ncbi:MAG: helix-turn-helix transcriptional regulator, partial [Streptomyces sp.]|nr:helix-turn-helix transcriptional regulator [Streptomyces sp.]
MSNHAPDEARVIPLRPQRGPSHGGEVPRTSSQPGRAPQPPAPREPLWRDLIGDVLRRERLAQERTLKDVAEAARISMPYLSELERGRKD